MKLIDSLTEDSILTLPFLQLNSYIMQMVLTEKDKKCFALIMGNEGRGVDSEILDMCDKYIYIELDKEVESLNVAVATSILLYELAR